MLKSWEGMLNSIKIALLTHIESIGLILENSVTPFSRALNRAPF